jgi:MOSC domain-containing protein YiiM
MLKPVVPIVLAGAVKPLPGDGRLSGIDKHPATGPWTISSTGLIGDAQADLKNHGGLEKALHQYPLDHHDIWPAEVGPHPLLGKPGAFGENLFTQGWTEDTICIGDVIRLAVPCCKSARVASPAGNSTSASAGMTWQGRSR